MSHRSRTRRLDTPLPSQTLSRFGAEDHFQSLRSQAFRDKYDSSGRGGNNSNSNGIRCIAWNGPGTRVACGYGDRSIRVWIPDHSDGRGLTDFKNAHETRGVESISWDPTHADRFASCSTDGGVKVWDARTKKLLAETRTGHENVLVRYSGDGRFLAVATAKTDLVLIYHIKRDVDPSIPAVTSNGRHSKGQILTWELVELCQYRENQEVYDLQWAENGSRTAYILASGLGNGAIRIYQFNTSDSLEHEKKSDTPRKSTEGESLDNETNTDAVTNTLQRVFTLRGHRTALNCLAFDPKARYIAVGSNEGIVSLWDLEEFICIKTFTKTE